MGFLFRLFQFILSGAERFVLEPLFWLLVILFKEGLANIKDARIGYPKTISRFELIISGLSLMSLSLIYLYIYWFWNFNSPLMNI